MEMWRNVKHSLILESQEKIHNRSTGNTWHPTSRPDRLDKHRQKLKCMWKQGNFGGTQVHRIINQTNLTKRGQEHDKTRKNRNINESKTRHRQSRILTYRPLLEGASLHRKRGAGMGGNLERGSVGSWWGERPGRWWRRDEPGRRQEGLEAGGARRDPGHSHDSGMAADSRGGDQRRWSRWWRRRADEAGRWGGPGGPRWNRWHHDRGRGVDPEGRGRAGATEDWGRVKGMDEPDGAGRTKVRGTAGGVESRGVGWSTPDQGTS